MRAAKVALCTILVRVWLAMSICFGVRVGVWVQDYTCFGGGLRAWVRFACFEGVQNKKECMV